MKMLKETYFAILPKIKVENHYALFIAVSRSVPRGYDLTRYIELAPSQQLLNAYKNGEIQWSEYTRLFKIEMDNSICKRTMRQIKDYSVDHDVFLICWEGPGKPCHRHLLIEMINEME
jgi:uncharacterized protein YeaO (DUF488 family)